MFARTWIAGLACVAAVALAIAGLSTAGTGEKKVDKDEPKTRPTLTEAGKAVERDALAGKLIHMGRSDKSPTALILAAEILLNNGTPGKPGEKIETKDLGKADKYDLVKEVKNLLAEAAKMKGGDDEANKALALRVSKQIDEKPRSPESGFFSVGGVIPQGSGWRNVMNVTLRDGEVTNFSLRNLSNNSDLDLRVFDFNGALISQDVRTAPDAFVSINVFQRGRFRVEIRNFAGPAAQYSLTAN